MLVSGIKSRPVYPGLVADAYARRHLLVCDAAGSDAVGELFAKADAAFAPRAKVLLITEGLSSDAVTAFRTTLASADVETLPTLASALARLDALLSTATMGVRLYAAGTEPVIGSVVQTGLAHCIDHLSIRTEHRGSLKRRVQCVHCKGMTEDVTTNPVRCAHCGLHLLVRDHYSRRLAAFQGVCIDAECPGDVPEPKVEFL